MRKLALIAEAAVVVATVRMALTLLPFRIVQRGIDAMARLRSTYAPPHQIARAVAIVATGVPRASCLTQALAARLLLARHGHAAAVRVGVAKNDDGTLRAHAWVESNGLPILGEPGAFTPFPVALS